MRLFLAVLLYLSTAPVASALTFFSIGAGDIGGAYFAVARAICDAVNRVGAPDMRCSAEATQGSTYNLEALMQGDIELALVQSDWQRLAWQGRGFFEGAPVRGLRSVMSLHAEPFTVLVRNGVGATTIASLRDRRVDLGHRSSGRRAIAELVFRSVGVDEGDFADVYELQSGAAVAELCAGSIDATLLIIGHPNDSVASALADCDASILPIAGLGGVLDNDALFEPATIPAGAYPQLVAPTPTFGVMATLVARADTPDEIVATVVREALAALPGVARRLPVLAGLDPEQMRTRGLSAPLHPAAEAAFAAYFAGR